MLGNFPLLIFNFMKRISKLLAIIIYYAFAQYLPNREFPLIGELCRRFRQMLCKMIFVSTGDWINIQRRVYFGRNIVKIGHESGLGEGFHVQNSELEIGDYVMTGPDVMVLGGGHVFKSKSQRIGSQGNLPKTKLVIEDDVWIGARVTILGNCRIIGKGAVVGACSVVTKDIPEYAIVAGNPAKVIGYRE